jgi:hypothetical protein
MEYLTGQWYKGKEKSDQCIFTSDQGQSMLALQIISAILACVFAVFTIMSQSREEGGSRLKLSARTSIAGLLVSLICSVLLFFVQAQQESASARDNELRRQSVEAEKKILTDVQADLQKNKQPIGSFDFYYAVSLSLKNKAVKSLEQRVGQLAKRQLEDVDDESEVVSLPVDSKTLKSSPFVWWVVQNQLIEISFFPKGTSFSQIEDRVSDTRRLFSSDPIPGAQLKFTLASPGKDGKSRPVFAFDRKPDALLLSDNSDESNLNEVWTDNSILSLDDLLGRPMLIEISTVDGDKPLYFTMTRFNLSPEQTLDVADFMDHTQLELLEITVAKRRFGFLGSEFRPVKSYRGTAFLTVWPPDMSALLKRQVQTEKP